jgi:DNA-binding transcriptional LysR family regulator
LAKLDRPLLWDDLRDQTFIANGTCSQIHYPEFQSYVKAAEIEVQNTTSLLALVAAGVEVTTLPRLAVPADREDVVFLNTGYEDLFRTIGILTSSDRSLSPACAALVETVANSLKSVSSSN